MYTMASMDIGMPKTALFVMLLAASGIANASVVTFNLSGILEDGSALGGSFNLDTTTGLATTVNIALGPPDSVLLTVIRVDSINGTDWELAGGTAAMGIPFQSLFFPVQSLVGYTGGQLCSLTLECQGLSVFIGGPSG